MADCKTISLLGSTGSIGTQTLEIVRAFPGRFRVAALAARCNAELLAAQAREFRPTHLAIADLDAAERLAGVASELGAELLAGPDSLEWAATVGSPDLVVAAAVGFAGVAPALAAARAGIDIALANKEALVCAGELIAPEARRRGARLLPVDSEHNALFQCLEGRPHSHVRRLILTASGGPFRRRPRSQLAGVTREEVLNHPNWDMGAKVTVDSATMMNKGFEVIEAMWLFGLPVDRIATIIHPQSTVHSMVELLDGSILAQLGPTDMRLPIQHALLYPECRPSPVPPLDLARLGPLEFAEVDLEQFPLLGLAYEAARAGSRAATALNALNEAAVDAFLRGKVGFLAMQEAILALFDALRRDIDIWTPSSGEPPSYAELQAIDRAGRQAVAQHLKLEVSSL